MVGRYHHHRHRVISATSDVLWPVSSSGDRREEGLWHVPVLEQAMVGTGAEPVVRVSGPGGPRPVFSLPGSFLSIFFFFFN